VNNYWQSFLEATSPGLALALVALLAALPAYSLLRQSERGRARSAIAYLMGLATGLTAAVALSTLLGRLAHVAMVGEAGLVGAFFAPFAGMLCAKWQGPIKLKRPRRGSGNSTATSGLAP
jgi:hypothetical protein